jgi:uncharacterized membrane protein YfcA
MATVTILLLAVVFLAAALLYSAVGQAGASGYLAVMALFGMQPQAMKPTALALNILVATIAAIKFYRAGHFSWKIFWPFAVASIPFSFIGGYIALPASVYKPVISAVLLYAAYRLFRVSQSTAIIEQRPLPAPAGVLSGAGIGFVSGLTGIGGGIFLTPLLLFMGWAEAPQAAAVSAVFILVNSIAGLSGNLTSLGMLPQGIWVWGIAAAVGGWIGAEYGSRHFNSVVLKRLLVLVLVIGAVKIAFA